MERVSRNCLCTTTKAGEAWDGPSCPVFLLHAQKCASQLSTSGSGQRGVQPKRDLSGVGRSWCVSFKTWLGALAGSVLVGYER